MTDRYRYERIRKTLARYSPDTVYIGTGEYVAECVRADDGDYYLAVEVDAEIEALQDEIEALRAEVDVWKASFEQAAAGHATYSERTEQLEKVLRKILENEATDWKFVEEFGGYVLHDELREEARAALGKEGEQ